MINNYDSIAGSYDFLSRMAFGKSQIQSQRCLLDFISPNNSILIVGGGSGWILEEITKIHPSGLDIIYVEQSEKMTALARGRNTVFNPVCFVTLPVEEFQTAKQFDVIITAFLFDNFSQARTTRVINKLDAMLKKEGKWLFTDFQNNGSLWQKSILYVMYSFFGILCNVEAKELPETHRLFIRKGYRSQLIAEYFGKFISSLVYYK